ncbi:hypothetical protein [Actinophytocola oryzae]|nr:hypothetical protein [Actinophytocola oryzae]
MRRALLLMATVGSLVTGCASGTEGTPVSAREPRGKTTKTSTSRAPFHGERLADGEVVKVDELDGIRLGSPDDGRLRNYGVDVDVVDFGTADVVDGGAGTDYGAQEDSTLLAFRLRVATFVDDAAEKVKATVSVDGRQRSLPEFEYSLGGPGDDRTLQYLVGVPKDRREVQLELKYADFAQQFDLLDGKRTGEQPDILYRSDDAPFVYVENLTPAKLPLADEDGKPGAYVVGVTRAELTYFGPELGDVPADKEKAWLVIDYEPGSEGSLDYLSEASACVPPFTAFTLNNGIQDYPAVDRQSKVEALASDQRLAFEVPADLTDATLTMKTTELSCDFGGLAFPFTASGEAKVTMTLPQD